MSFASLGLSEALVRVIEAAGYAEPTPVQQRAIPAVLQGRDLMVTAQTGTGKTGCFAIPILERLFPNGHQDKPQRHWPRQPRALILTPTRELATQIHKSFQLYADELQLVSACVFGGVNLNAQVKAMSSGVDVLVACPGRLLDLCNQGNIDISHVEILVLDEADRMLDMGFVHAVKKILASLPAKRQNLLFSATFSNDITALARKLLQNPEHIEVTPPNSTVERIEQRVFRVAADHKRALLAHLFTINAWKQVLVFTRTKHGANRLAKHLDKHGFTAVAIHGNKSQNARTKALANFKDGSVRILVATDIAARGLDIDQLPHVVNFELPNVYEDYIHRIGRTGRIGRSGKAISLVAPEEEKLLNSIEHMTKQKIAAGDPLGFNASAVKTEKLETRERSDMCNPRKSNSDDMNNSGSGRRDKNKNTGRAEKASTDRHDKHLARTPKLHDRTTVRKQHKLPHTPVDRAPDEFLDDDVDNFGNRIDYVPQTKITTGRSYQPHNRHQNYLRNNDRQTSNYQPRSSERAKQYLSGSQVPKIIHKESKANRFQAPEQLNELPDRLYRKKPALLTRNR
ncbi:DEAD/DEAH box helicase [Candidatus Pseudomonas adelgestsugas]|uniref:ATP-dependent RNA helicase RhlE n=1 Tax=Candidatus Pseudomonas adelgestsugas TaxID=1302376 RepID=A0ABX5R749_9PSED|nr:DEAD/DEAH box helicase [Candidatus Pseudomonas adelgestsugas]QAX81467.1 ATP-dependent RNA helicase RhlE [Candidatus Pseudomonas adelgestsugas]